MLRKLFFIGLFVYWIIGLFAVPLAQADSQDLTVTGTVIPHASDFQLTLSSDTANIVAQDTVITYTITYGSHLLYADQLTVQAQWYQGTVSGNTSANIDGLSYVSGSGSNAYNNTTPVVDLTNNKITWTISSFPQTTTDKIVSFQLKTTTAYTGSSSVNYPIKVRLITPNYTTSDQAGYNSYLYDPSKAQQTQSSSSNSSSNTSSTAPTSAPATTAQPTTKPSSPSTATQTTTTSSTTQAHVNSVNVVDLSQNNAQIAITLNKTGNVKVIYGTNPNNLDGIADTAISGNSGLVSMDSLDPQTTYYMQILTTGIDGKTTKSEIFSVQTAQISDKPEVSKSSIVVATDNDVLYSSGLNSQQGQSTSTKLNATPTIPISQDTDYTLAFKLTKTQNIKTVTMILRNTSVLGLAPFAPTPQPLEYSFPVSQKGNGTYSVQITDPTIAGTYDAYIKITDYDGNVTTQKIAEIRSLKPFREYNAQTKKPIEDIRIFIFRQNPDTKKFEPLSNINGTRNPIYTDIHGEASVQLSKGTYKINTGRIGYKGQDNIVFSIGTTPKDDFPTVYLQPTSITPLSLYVYYHNAFIDWLSTTQAYILSIQASNRFFDLFALTVIFCFVISTFYLFRFKTHIAFSHFPYYFHHHSLLLFGGYESHYIHWSVIDKERKKPIADGSLFLLDEQKHRGLVQITTSKTGTFVLSAEKIDGYLLYVMKPGYEPSGQVAYEPQIVVALQKGEAVKKKILEVIQEETENAFALLFEFWLVFSVILELILFPAFGYYKTIPFLLLSLLNVILWGFYLREKDKQVSVN